MNPRASWFPWIACLVAGGLAGFGLGSARLARDTSAVRTAQDVSGFKAPPPVSASAFVDTPPPAADVGLQPFPPGFEGLSYEEICRKGPASARYVALLAWCDRVPREELVATVEKLVRSLNSGAIFNPTFALNMLMARWGEKDPVLALAALRSNPLGRRMPVWGWPALMGTMARSHPDMARQVFEESSFISLQPASVRLLTDFGIALGAGDSSAALKWATNLSGSQRTTALAILLQSKEFSSAEVAEELRPYLSLPEVRRSLKERWSKEDPVAAVTWMKSFYAGEKAGLLAEWSIDNPGAALAWSKANLEPEQQAVEWPGLAYDLGRHDPAAAGQWIESLPAGEARHKSIEELARSWNQEATLAWVRALPERAEQDAGLLSFAKVRAEDRDFESSLAAAASASPTAPNRLEQLKSTLRNWHTHDAASAERWLKESPLNGEEKSVLRVEMTKSKE